MPAIDPALFTTSIDATAFPLEGRCGPAAAGKNAGLERFVYDCTEDLGRRKSPVPLLRGEDDELPMYRRMQVVTLGRDIRRNFAVAAWAIRRHLDYVARFRFRSTTGDEKIDARVNDLIDWCSKPWNFDAARRHSRRKFTRLVEASRCVDGDVLTVKRTSGRLQAIEGDRIRTPLNYGKAVRPLSAETLRKMKFGVVTDDNGAALAYAVNRRGPEVRVGPDLIVPANSFIFERLVPARHAIHVAYFDRFDQTRGISPVAAALNQFRDIYEGFDYALAQAKVAQLFALVIKRGSPEALDEFQTRLSKGGKLTDYKDQIDFKRGPCMLDLDPQDVAEFMQSNNPSANWQAFMNMVIAAALKALDIPYSFYDESHTNYSGSRGAWLHAEGARFLEKFGAAGARWFAEGLSYGEAQDRYAAALAEENEALKTRMAGAQLAGAAAGGPLSFGEEQPLSSEAAGTDAVSPALTDAQRRYGKNLGAFMLACAPPKE